MRLVGRDAILAFTQKVLPGAFVAGTVRYEIERIRLITYDVALTSVNQEYLDGDGRSLTPPRAGRTTYVWHRRDGRWLITSGQNASVPHGAGDARLANEPAGYWTGAAHEAIIDHIRIEDGKVGVTQRHWMTLNALASSEEGMTRAEITSRLGQYMTPQIGSVDPRVRPGGCGGTVPPDRCRHGQTGLDRCRRRSDPRSPAHRNRG